MHARTVSHLPRAAGFTLVELMIVIVIATILLSIAVPSYMSQIRESRRTDARTALLDLAGREESYNATMNAYAPFATSLGYATTSPSIGSGYYTITVACVAAYGATLSCDTNANAPAGPSYYLTATPVAGTSQAKDSQCTSFSVDSQGNQFSTGSAPTTTCWSSQ
ncbi:MAG: type IV pilin protein [Steroidobacteraceae bacterium]